MQTKNIVPLHAEPLARGIVNFFGGPHGRFASRPPKVMAFIASVGWIFLAFAYLSKANCARGRRDGDIVNLNWDGNRHLTSFCYNDILPLYGARGLDKPGFVYGYSWIEDGVTRYMEYPVLAGMFQGVMGKIAHSTYGLVKWATVAEAGWYFALTALVLSVLWVLTLRMVVDLAGARPWDTLLVAASPLVIIHAFTNWDIPSITLAVAGLWMASRRRNWVAGIFLGLGAAFKLWPVFMLGAFLVLALRNRTWVSFFKVLGGTVGAWAVVNAPVALLYPEAWGEFYRMNSSRGWEWTTIYAVLARTFSFSAPVEAINTFSLIAFLSCCVAIAIFGLKVSRQPRIAELVYLIIMTFLLFNKVWSPQYSLWLLVPAVLALPNWRLIATWGFFDALVWPILMWHMLGTDKKGAPEWLLDVAIMFRDGFIIAIGVLVIMQMLGKRPDKVLEANGEDVLAGDFSAPQEVAAR